MVEPGQDDLAERAARHDALRREALGQPTGEHTTASGRWRPWAVIVMASIGQVLGWLLVGAGTGGRQDDSNVVLLALGVVVAGVSGIYLAIGVIAEGMRLGAAWIAEDRPGHRRTS
ncbi:hypothetical protein [Nocardioides salarius]|uniref:hypothetical protein n=1 Tax=Nocardioides salarius TaxID=374513 RepID=UPI0030FC7F43